MKDFLEEIIGYRTNSNDPKTMALIRAMELSIRAKESTWSSAFWGECLAKTDCIPPASSWRPDDSNSSLEALIHGVEEVRASVQQHFATTVATSDVDAKHDATFGLVFYALDLLDELSSEFNRFSIIGRLIVRTLTECRITLAYLIKQNDADRKSVV